MPQVDGLTTVADAFASAWQLTWAYFPNLLGALGILLAGYLVARVTKRWTIRLVGALDRLARKTPLRKEVEDARVDGFASQLIGRVAFWVVFLFFIAAAGEALGLRIVTGAVTRLSIYLPNVLAAIVVVVIGLVAGSFVRATLVKAAAAAGVSQAVALAEGARLSVMAVAVVVAVDQLGIDSTLLIVAAGVTLGAVIGAIGLAFGLGARVAVSNIIAAHQAAQLYRIGERIRIGDVAGSIAEIRPMGVLIDAEQGRVFVPAREFLDQTSTRLLRTD